MRILILSHMYPDDLSPTNGIFVHEQVRALRDRGIDVRVVTGSPLWLDPLAPRTTIRRFIGRRQSRAWETHDGVPVMRFEYPMPRGLWRWIDAPRYASGALAAANAVHVEFPFALVHAHTSLLDGLAGTRIARRYRTPLIITEHTGPFDTLTANYWTRRATARALAEADRILPVSHSLQRDMERAVPIDRRERISVVGNGVDATLFDCGSDGAETQGHITALWVGHLVEIKRVPLLLAAFAAAQRQEPRLKLTLLGSGPCETAIDAHIEALGLGAAVERLPRSNRAEVARRMREAQFLVLTSRAETFGAVVVEALASGTPVLSTRCGGPEESLSDPSLGRLVHGTEEALTAGLLYMARSHGRFDPAHLRNHALSRFGYDVISNRLASIYEASLAGADRGPH